MPKMIDDYDDLDPSDDMYANRRAHRPKKKKHRAVRKKPGAKGHTFDDYEYYSYYDDEYDQYDYSDDDLPRNFRTYDE